eukprot:maker-scaffold299_size217019-snap-gene-1.32 protein:Tk09200 transcript:maker-scaffold299_size217019-snap-gene-1.32-mRNA-1 annotation:"27 kda hemolymph"
MVGPLVLHILWAGILGHVGGSISQSSSSASSFDDDFFEGDANAVFDQMDKEDRFHEALDEGFDTWEERCLKIGGQSALDNWLAAQEHLVFCVMQNFDISKIQRQIETKKKSGDLDVVFKEYCGQPVAQTRPCVENFLEVSRHCVGIDEDRNGLNITMKMVDAAVNFICHNNGDRLALFMSESGLDCLKSRQESIMRCLNSSSPEMFHSRRSKSNLNWVLFDAQNCRKGEVIRHCVETELLKCDDPTPSNVVNSMMLAMRNATPCRRMSSRYASSSDTPTPVHAFQFAAFFFTALMIRPPILPH